MTLLGGPAQADDTKRRGGEWQIVVTGMAAQPQSMEVCYAATPWQKMLAPPAGLTCRKSDVARTGSQITFDVDCDGFVTRGTATLSGDSGFTSDQTLKIGSGGDAKSSHVTTQAKWIGACKPGEEPLGGD